MYLVLQRALLVLLVALAVGTGSTTSAARTSAPMDSLAHYYARNAAAPIARLMRQARTQEERLLCRYRLYPLTQESDLVSDIPAAADARTAREAALISGLWGYRAARASPLQLPTYGRRSMSALDRARRLNPDEPYVLLIDGQSLLYRPALFGGNAREAQRRFERLRTVLNGRAVDGLLPIEAEVWVWMALRRQNSEQAEPLRRRLLAGNPPPLFRQFLTDPP